MTTRNRLPSARRAQTPQPTLSPPCSISATHDPTLSSTDAADIAAFVTLPSDVLVAPQPLVAASLTVLSPSHFSTPPRPSPTPTGVTGNRHRPSSARGRGGGGGRRDVEYEPMAGDDARRRRDADDR